MNETNLNEATAPRSVAQQQDCSAVARHLRPQLGGDTQRVLPSDWMLCMCSQSSGKKVVSDWGPESVMREVMVLAFSQDRDVWLMAPDGTKHLPNVPDEATPDLTTK